MVFDIGFMDSGSGFRV